MADRTQGNRGARLRRYREGFSRLPLKGFRPGRVPAGAVEAFFRDQIRHDMMAAASRRLCRMALDKEGIEAGGGAIEVSDCDLRQWDSMRFKASFIEMPRFELSDYKSLEIEATDYFGRLDEISARLLTRTGVEPYPAQVEHELRYAGADSADDRQAAAGRMKLMMILKRIALQESIGIDERDIGTLAAENEVTVGELKRFWAEGDGLSRLADTLSAEAVLSYLDEIQEPAHIPA